MRSIESLFADKTAARMIARAVGLALGLGLVVSLSAGCVVRAGAAADYPVVEVQTVPATIETYPHVVYQGRTTYLVDDRWYYRRGERWVVYQREPAELTRHRTTNRQPSRVPVQAVPVERGRGRSY